MFVRGRRGIVLWIALAVVTAAPAGAQVVRQVTNVLTSAPGPGALDDAGTTVFTGASSDVDGGNPDHAFQIHRFDAVTGAATRLTADRRGVTGVVSVSDDGQWLAFASTADLTGQNHDKSAELFVMPAAGGPATQITTDPAPNAGSVSTVVLSGDGSRIAFTANTDPLGTNPAHDDQLFVIQRDGSGLRQLTNAGGADFGAVAISDDGARIVFVSNGDLTGANPDLGNEVFAVLGDGTGLRQLTATEAGYDSSAPSLAGNGTRVAFQSNGDLTGGNALHQDEIFIVEWEGTGLRQLTSTTTVIGAFGDPASQAPSITDDGATIYYHSNQSTLFPPLNLDGNFEIFRIGSDGTGRQVLTSTLLQAGSVLPVVAGGGGRVAYYEIDTQVTLRAMDGGGGSKVDLLRSNLVFHGAPDVTPDETRAVFVRSPGLFGGGQVWRVETDGSDPEQVTFLDSGSAATPSIAADRNTIVFSADSDPVGSNADLSDEIFLVHADGTGMVQLTSGPSGTSSLHPVLAASGSVVAFDSDADLAGGNADGSREIFRVLPDGTGVVQLTDGPAGTESRLPRVDASGAWVVFESNADLDGGNPDGGFEVYRVPASGGASEAITGDPAADSSAPDLSADGARIVYQSTADPLGTNPEGNREIFEYEPATSTRRQLTVAAEGDSGGARISGDGAWVVFSSNAPFFENDPDLPSDLYRVPAAGGGVERVGALRGALPGGVAGLGEAGGTGLAVGDAGAAAVFTAIGDFTARNADQLPEVWVVDRLGTPNIRVGKATPTEVRWIPESGPLRYDVIRGDTAALRFGDGGVVDLGPVFCVEDDSPDADTLGWEDPDAPAPGQAFFYLYRGSQGLLAGPGSYGTGSAGGERVAGVGDCPAQ